MAKFGLDHSEFTLVKTRWGICHCIAVGTDGALAHCRRNPATCKFCHEHGVPVAEPDPFDVALKLILDNWDKQWIESTRVARNLGPDEFWPAEGVHIAAVDDKTRARTVIASFGENDACMGAISALVEAHNIKIGRAD